MSDKCTDCGSNVMYCRCEPGMLRKIDTLERELAALRERAETAERERDEARAILDREAEKPIEIKELTIRDGKLDLAMTHPIAHLITAELASLFKSAGGENYVEFTMYHKELGPLTMMLQRQEGKTPAQVNATLTARVAELEGGVRRVIDSIKCGYGKRDVTDALAILRPLVDSATPTPLPVAEPRRMRGNPSCVGYHGSEHDEDKGCECMVPCTPVDDVCVTKIMECSCGQLWNGTDKDVCPECGKKVEVGE